MLALTSNYLFCWSVNCFSERFIILKIKQKKKRSWLWVDQFKQVMKLYSPLKSHESDNIYFSNRSIHSVDRRHAFKPKISHAYHTKLTDWISHRCQTDIIGTREDSARFSESSSSLSFCSLSIAKAVSNKTRGDAISCTSCLTSLVSQDHTYIP
jgi:hypothetical protein